jgi:hypothetical protein
MIRSDTTARLRAEAIRRLWDLADAASVISEHGDAATVDQWMALHLAVANLPPRDSLS